MRSLFPEFLRISRENGSTFRSDGDLLPLSFLRKLKNRSKIARWLNPITIVNFLPGSGLGHSRNVQGALGALCSVHGMCIRGGTWRKKSMEKGEGTGEATHQLDKSE